MSNKRRMKEPDATMHHSKLVEALIVELREYGVSSLAGIVATLCEGDGNHAVRVWGDAFRRIEDRAPDAARSFATANAGPLTGRRIKTKVSDSDTGDDDRERLIPIGTCGNVGEFNGESYEIQWDNGGMTLWLPDEIGRDADVVEEP